MLTGDLVINSVTLADVSPGLLHYSATVANIGDQSIVANNVSLQSYLSDDATYNVGDEPAGGVGVNINLLPNTAQIANFSANYTLEEYQSHSFLLLIIDNGSSVNEANENNNVIAVQLPGLPIVTTSNGASSGKSGKYVPIDPQATFTDKDNGSLAGTVIAVSTNGEFAETDAFSVRKYKTDAGTIKAVKGELRLGKAVIGTVTNGGPGTGLEITITSAEVNKATISSVLRSINLRTPKKTPGVRGVHLQVTQPMSVTGPLAEKEVNLS